MSDRTRKTKTEDTTRTEVYIAPPSLIGKYFEWVTEWCSYDHTIQKDAVRYLVLDIDEKNNMLLVRRSKEYVKNFQPHNCSHKECGWQRFCRRNQKQPHVHKSCTPLKEWIRNISNGNLKEVPVVLGCLYCGTMENYREEE